MQYVTEFADHACGKRHASSIACANKSLVQLVCLFGASALLLMMLSIGTAQQIVVDRPDSSSTSDRTGHHEEMPFAKPEDAQMSSDALALVTPQLQLLVDQQKVPGAIVMVARHGKVVLFEAVGWSDIERLLEDTVKSLVYEAIIP